MVGFGGGVGHFLVVGSRRVWKDVDFICRGRRGLSSQWNGMVESING